MIANLPASNYYKPSDLVDLFSRRLQAARTKVPNQFDNRAISFRKHCMGLASIEIESR